MLLAACEVPPEAQDAESVFALLQLPTPAQAARDAADPYDPGKRYRGTVLLANAPFGGEDVYLRLYVARLEEPDPDPAVRAVAALALGMHGGPEHVPLLLRFIDDEDRLVRHSVTRALQRLHNADAVRPLLERLDPRREDERDVRAEAADALAQYPSREVLQGLIGALDDDQLAVSTIAERSLRTLTGQDLGPEPATWLAWAEEASNPFEGQQAYIYPVFRRDRSILEYLPFWPPPPNEIAASPAGFEAPRRVTPLPEPAKPATDEPSTPEPAAPGR